MGWAPDAAERRRSRWLTPATLALHTQSMIAGAGGGFVSSIATCPLDVIKTKLQAQAAAHRSATYRGVVDTIRHVWTTSGVKGFYRGLGPTILGYLPTWAIYFAVYDSIKQSFGELPLGAPARQQAQHDEREPKDGRNSRIYPAAQVHFYQPSIREHPWTLHILSAMCAGACSTIATNPLWVVKTRFMTQPPEDRPYRHTLDAVKTIYSTEGPKAFYRGLGSSLLGISHVAVQFPFYEALKKWMQKDNAPLTPQQLLLCSAMSKMVASVVTYPHEVIRTRLQTQKRLRQGDGSVTPTDATKYRSILQTTKTIWAEESWRGLYKGLSINLARTVPNSAVTMLTYELLMRYLMT